MIIRLSLHLGSVSLSHPGSLSLLPQISCLLCPVPSVSPSPSLNRSGAAEMVALEKPNYHMCQIKSFSKPYLSKSLIFDTPGLDVIIHISCQLLHHTVSSWKQNISHSTRGTHLETAFYHYLRKSSLKLTLIYFKLHHLL